jgi:hypothetical protein
MPAQKQPTRRWAVTGPGGRVGRSIMVVHHDEAAARANADRLNRGTAGLDPYGVAPICSHVDCDRAVGGGPVSLIGYHESARYCSPQCRSAQWKRDHNYGAQRPRQRRTNAGPPPLVGVKLRRELNEAIKPVAADAGLSVREWVERVITDALG